MSEELTKLANSLERLGVRGTALVLSQRFDLPLGRSEGCHALRVKQVAHPLLCRAGTSDFQVFNDIFLRGQYSDAADLIDVELIVDCGANAGYTSAFFLSRYPGADLIAVEPDPGNFELLERNTRHYGRRVSTIRSAVWSHRTELTLAGRYRDRGEEWARQVTESASDRESGIVAVTIDELLRDSGHSRISILKMDIEGAEEIVFSEGCEEWLSKVDNLLIELHDDVAFPRAREVFHNALANQEFSMFESGELTVCRRNVR
jgi:FkbM family methyltransferase